MRSEIYEQLEEESPYKQKVPEKRSENFNSIKVKSNKTPKVKT